ncbi:MAG: hypothetical protein K8H86_02300 [Ignavibacteriaceae bacterium]|nr:hypothetical protein [Ignavibacteriaceae bacterium]
MNFLSKNNIDTPGLEETVFRVSPWGTFLGFLVFLAGALLGVMFFIFSYQSKVIWEMVLSFLYSAMMFGVCKILFRALRGLCSDKNWLAKISPDGIVLNYRSYLHNDLPPDDPTAMQLLWSDIKEAHIQLELHTTTDTDGEGTIRRWFLALTLAQNSSNIESAKRALEFENKRKPDYTKLADLKHKLFTARKDRAGSSEILSIKNEIALEKKRNPGVRIKGRFSARPVVFTGEDRLRMELTHITPNKKKLRQLLEQRIKVIDDDKKRFDIELPMNEEKFNSLLAVLISRDEIIGAVKLVKKHKGLSTTEAKLFVDKIRETQTSVI